MTISTIMWILISVAMVAVILRSVNCAARGGRRSCGGIGAAVGLCFAICFVLAFGGLALTWLYLGQSRPDTATEANRSEHIEHREHSLEVIEDGSHDPMWIDDVGEPEIAQAPPAPPVPPDASGPGGSPSDLTGLSSPAWLAADEVYLVADVYPSPEAAARGLAAQAMRMAPEALGADATLRRLFIWPMTEADTPLAAVVIETLSEHHPSLRAELTEPSGRDEPGEGEAVSVISNHPDGDGGGRVQLRMRGSHGSTVRFAEWVDKPWVESLGAWQAAHPEGQWIVGMSRVPFTDANDANRDAVRDAAEQVLTQTLRAIAPRATVGNTTPLLNLVNEALASRAGIRDRFVQRFDRPGGDVYRGLVLVDASDPAIRQIADRYLEHRRSLVWRFVSGAVLLAVVVALYWFLNAATKGYYAGTLRMAVVVLAVLGIVVLLAVWR